MKTLAFASFSLLYSTIFNPSVGPPGLLLGFAEDVAVHHGAGDQQPRADGVGFDADDLAHRAEAAAL